jgi:PAS domain S-box-containing protein
MQSVTKLPSDVFAVIAQTSSEGVIIVDRNGVLVFSNPSAASIFGYSPDALVGHPISLVLPEELRGLTYAKGPVETAGLHQSGRRIPLEISFAQARNHDEILIAAFLRDLTERHWSHARLAAQYAVAEILSSAEDEDTTLSGILSSVGPNLGFAVGNVWMVEDERLRWHSSWHSPQTNSQAFLDESRRCAFARNEGLPGRAWAAAAPCWISTLEEDHNFPRINAALASDLHSGVAFPFRSGDEVVGVIEYSSAYVRPLEPTLLQILTAIGQQISVAISKHRAQSALRSTEVQHHTLFEHSNDAFGVSTSEHFVYVNRAFAQMFGWARPEELAGVSIYETIPAPRHAMVREHRQRRHAGLPEPMQYESIGMRKDGTEFPTEVRATDYWIEGKMYTLAIMRDTTREREARDILTQSNQALRRANADLEQFAYAASHDLQEPLRVVTLFSQLLDRRHHDALPEDAQQLLATINDAARRINELVQDLLSYTKTASLDGVAPPVDSNSVLAEAVNALQQPIANSRAIITNNDLPVLRVHRTHLFQLLQNLLSNSIKYSNSQRRPEIHVSIRPYERDLVDLQVQDNGIGIAPEYHERIFGVFKRLHNATVPGTGIGLAICKKIAEHYGGSIWVESEEDEGSTFHVTLPAA